MVLAGGMVAIGSKKTSATSAQSIEDALHPYFADTKLVESHTYVPLCVVR